MIALILALMLALIALGLPIAIALLIVSVLYFFLTDLPLLLVAQHMLNGASSFILIAVPLFILAGQLMNNGGVTKRIIRFCMALLGSSRGGLAKVNVFSSMIFAGISGEAVADTAGLGGVLIPAMKKAGYTAHHSAAITASSAVAGPIIPPSIPMIICASLAQVSVGQMFLGGAIPGFLFIIGSLSFIHISSTRSGFPSGEKTPPGELRAAFMDAVWALLAPIVIVGALVSGIVTVTEAAVIGVIYVFIIGKFVYKELDVKILLSQVAYTASLTGAIMFILAAAKAYTYTLTREQVANVLTSSIIGITDNTTLIFFCIIAVGLVIGSILSTTAGLLLMVPLLAPLVPQTGMDPIQFYVLITVALCIGTLTPPVGINLYLASSIAGAEPMKVFMKSAPYIGILLLIIVLSTIFPEIVIWLPRAVYAV